MSWIDAMLREDLTAPRKQRHTVERIRVRLSAEHGFDTGAYSTLCAYVAPRRPQIEAEARQARRHLEQQIAQPGRRLELTDDHRLAVVRRDRPDLPFEPQPFPGVGVQVPVLSRVRLYVRSLPYRHEHQTISPTLM